MDPNTLRNKRETYLGKYVGTVRKLGPESHIVNTDPSNFLSNLKDAVPEVATGQVVQGAKTAMGLKKKPQEKDTSTTHKMVVEITTDKIMATVDGEELSDCGYKVGVEGGGVPRLLANDMDVSLVIEEFTADETRAQKVNAGLNSPGDGGILTRVKS